MFLIFKKEINAFLNSLIAYVVLGIFLLAMGLMMWIFPETNVLDFGYADLSALFIWAPYIFIFLIPAITMRALAEENKAGTIEILYTLPLKNWQIIGGKFLACFFLV